MIKYEITKEDFAVFNQYHTKHLAPFVQKYLEYIFLLVPVILLFNSREVLLNAELRQKANLLALSPIAIVSVAAVVMFFMGRKGGFAKRAANRFYKRNPELFGMREIELTENALICTSIKGRTEYKYEGLEGLIDQPQYYFVKMNKIAAIIIPKNAITDKADEEMIRKKIKPFTKK